jgi:transposase
VNTDKRDARRLARLHRAGELVAIAIPTPEQEAVRDLCRARQRLDKFLLRHDRVYRAGRAWTARHELWLDGLRFDDAALRATFGHYRGVLSARGAELAAVEASLASWVDHGPFAAATYRLAAYRGIAYVGGLTLAAEVFDWRRFGCAMQFVGFTGLVPSEYSSGESVRRGHITKAGNGYVRAQLIESAWSYQHHAAVGVDLKRRQQHAEAATIAPSWAAQQRLCGRFDRLSARITDKKIVVTQLLIADQRWRAAAAPPPVDLQHPGPHVPGRPQQPETPPPLGRGHPHTDAGGAVHHPNRIRIPTPRHRPKSITPV